MTEEEELAIIAAAFPPKPICSGPNAPHAFRQGETLKEYFARHGTPADPAVMAEYEKSMRENVIPAIERDMKEQQRLAHLARLGIPRRLWGKS